MRHLTILLSACLFWALPLSLYAQKTSQDLDLAKWLIFEENYEDAQKTLQNTQLQNEKASDEIQYYLGLIAIHQNKLLEAKSIFQQQIDKKEKSPFCWAGMGHLYAAQRDLSYSALCLKKAEKYGNRNKLAISLAIEKAAHIGQAAKKADWRVFLVSMIDKYPLEISPRLELFQYYREKGIFGLAIPTGVSLLPMVPRKAKIFVQLAELHVEQWKKAPLNAERGEILKTAYRYVQEAFADTPGYTDAYRIRAELYLRSNFPGKFQKARDDMARYLSLEGHDQEAQIQYAKFLFLTEDYHESLELISKLKAQGVKNKVLLRLQSISLVKLGNPTLAKTVMDQYFEQVKPAYRISKDYENYGDILRQLYSPQEAQSYYQLAIDLDEERVSLYGELADQYFEEAKALTKQRYQVRKEGRAATVELEKLIATYNSLARKENVSKADLEKTEELMDEIILLKDGLEIAAATLLEYEAKEIVIYEKEAFYREKALRFEDGLSLRNQRRYGDALFNSQKYDLAEQAYIKVHELKEDYLYPYEKRLQIALRQARADGNEGPGMKRAVPVSQDIIRIFLPKAEQLKEKQQKSVLIALESMAVYSFDPEGENDCQAAKPYLEELKGLNQAYFDSQEGLKLIDDFCAE